MFNHLVDYLSCYGGGWRNPQKGCNGWNDICCAGTVHCCPFYDSITIPYQWHLTCDEPFYETSSYTFGDC
jgi:hypothetical protein